MSRFYYHGTSPDAHYDDGDRPARGVICAWCGCYEDECTHCPQCGAAMALGYRCDCDQESQDADRLRDAA